MTIIRHKVKIDCPNFPLMTTGKVIDMLYSYEKVRNTSSNSNYHHLSSIFFNRYLILVLQVTISSLLLFNISWFTIFCNIIFFHKSQRLHLPPLTIVCFSSFYLMFLGWPHHSLLLANNISRELCYLDIFHYSDLICGYEICFHSLSIKAE